MTTWHESILGTPQRELLRVLGPLATEHGYYLAGGTAVALHLGHRESVDYDFFATDPALHGTALRDALASALPRVVTSQVSEGTFNGVAGGVKVSFFRYRYPLLDPPERWSAFTVDIAGLYDLAAMKLSAIAQRGLKKDFIDLHALLRRGLSLAEMLDSYRRRFGVTDLAHVRASIVFFDDADDPMPRMSAAAPAADWAIIQNDIRRAARALK